MADGLKPDFPVPRHVAVIMDGNGRWAERAGLERLRGHEAGVESGRDIVEACTEWDVEHLTLYAFSTENWQRPTEEVDGLMAFLVHFLAEEQANMVRNGVRLRGLGRLDALPADVRAQLETTERATAGGQALTLRLALSYGGRQEIADAARRLAEEVAAGRLSLAEIDQQALAERLYDPTMPDPDLVIRTAGECRLSNFLLWQASYAEFHFSPVLWPDFRRGHLLEALRDYHGRVRRFGRVPQGGPGAGATA